MYRQTVSRLAPRVPRRWRAGWWLAALLIALLALPAQPALAAPLGQAAEPLGLGQYGVAQMSADESRRFTFDAPEDGVYIITAVDDVAAEDFDLIITGADGTVVYDDIFETTEVELQAGPVTLEFIAVADNTLAFVVVAQIGSMTTSEVQPGKLIPGGVYVGEDISESLYGRFTVPATAYPQQVLIYLEAGPEDDFWVSVDGDGVYNSLMTDDGKLLQFWTHGGDYTLYADPYNRRSSLTVVIFLSGPPQTLSVNTPQEGTILPGVTEMVYAVPLDATYAELFLEVESAEPLELVFFDRYNGGNISYYSYDEPTLELYDIYPGDYYVMLQANAPATAAIPFTLYVEGDAGRPMVQLVSDQVYNDTILDGDGTLIFSFDVEQAGAEVTVTLNGDADTDFDLYVGLRPGINVWSQYRFGSDETITFMAPIAGTYYAALVSNGDTGPFGLLVEEGGLATLLATNEVIVNTIDASARHVYRLETTRPNQLLSLILVGSEDEDLDVQVLGYNERGDNTVYASGFRNGSVEIVSDILTTPGLYEVVVNASYASATSAYFIEARVEDPAFVARQWAVDATASSQFGDDGWSAIQATGAPDTFTAGDQETAWAPEIADGDLETLELVYAYAVVPAGIAIVESFNPGAVVLIEAYDAEFDEWVALWEGEAAPAEEVYRIFTPELTSPDFATDRIRLTLDTGAVSGWNEIDAVQLFGRP